MKSRRTLPGASGEALIMALPNGRILGEVMPLLKRAGLEPEPAFTDPKSRKLRFSTSDPALDLMSSSSHAIAPASGAGAFAFTAPTTLPPASASQVGPA